MKIPKNKLPLKLGNKLIYGQYGIICKHPSPTKIQTNKFAGQIAYKDLSQYIIDAANNFPKALELINNLKLDMEHYIKYIDDPEALSLDNFEGSLFVINEFLNKLKNDK